MEYIDHKMYHKQATLFRAFLINYVLILIYWLAMMMPGFIEWAAGLTQMPPALLYINMITWLAIWKIAGAVLFLIPALAMWWERCSMKKYMK